MNIAKDGKIVEVENNPPHCNNMTEQCKCQCDNAEQEALKEEYRCKYHRPIKTSVKQISYKTKHELAFCDKIGSFTFLGKMFSKNVLLRDSLIANRGRVRWGGINQYEVKAHIEELLLEV